MATSVSYSSIRRDQRRERRSLLPRLAARIGDVDLPLRNWSLGGIAIDPTAGLMLVGDEVEGELVRIGHPDFGAVPFKAKVVRIDPENGALGLMFDTIEEHLLAFFDRCVTAAFSRR